MNMFCYQCQEAAQGTGCTVAGVCGKKSDLSAELDLLILAVRRLSVAATALRQAKVDFSNEAVVNRYVVEGLFMTITNANFDKKQIHERITVGYDLLEDLYNMASTNDVTLPEITEEAWLGVLSESNEDVRSLRELTIYGLKGLAAYVKHAMNLNYDDMNIHVFIQEAFFDMTTKDLSLEELTALVMKTGEYGVKGMALLILPIHLHMATLKSPRSILVLVRIQQS